jgi:hypothetical protein
MALRIAAMMGGATAPKTAQFTLVCDGQHRMTDPASLQLASTYDVFWRMALAQGWRQSPISGKWLGPCCPVPMDGAGPPAPRRRRR